VKIETKRLVPSKKRSGWMSQSFGFSKNEMLECDQCKATFARKRSVIVSGEKRYGNHRHFCSLDCLGLSRKADSA
jgi:hypothetical protein